MKSKKSNAFHFLTVSLTPATLALSVIIATPALAVNSIWNGSTTNIYNTAANWTPATAPTANADTATWNGTQAGTLSILWNGQIGGFGGNGVGLILTSGQTSPMSLNNTANASSLGISGITIASGAGAFTLGGTTGTPIIIFRAGGGSGTLDIPLVNNSIGNTATIKANVALQTGGGSARNVIFDGAGDWLVETALSTTNGFPPTIVKNGAGTLTATNTNTTQNTAYSINAGKLVVGGTGRLGGPLGVFGGTLAINGTLSFESSNTQTISSAISGTGVLTQTAGTLTLTGNSTRTGAATVTGGTMVLSGAGSLTLTEDGTPGTPSLIVTGALATTPANGTVTVNASQTTWASGTLFDLLTFCSFAGGAVTDFTKGTTSGLSVRQTADLVLDVNKLSLQITGENPVWTGLDSGSWVIGSTGGLGNWKFPVSGNPTDYIAGGDIVTFDDSVTTGTTAVTITAADVSPALVTFNNTSSPLRPSRLAPS